MSPEIVEKKFGTYEVRRRVVEHGVIERTVIREGRDTDATREWTKANTGERCREREAAFIARMSGDGCVSVEVPINFLYPGEGLAAAAWALQRMHDERTRTLKQNELEWLVDHGDRTQHYGSSVDLSINQAKSILLGDPVRICEVVTPAGGFFATEVRSHKLEVQYAGEWWEVCRTDLMDNVCTGGFERYYDATNARSRWIAKVRFGARLIKHEDGRRSFAVVDSTTDG